jgi:transcriptional regulator with XRE-family HTH domain
MLAVAKYKSMPPRKRKAPEAVAFGAKVRQVRTKRKLTQEALAEAAGIAAIQVGFIERGENVPKLTMILKLARALGVRPGSLIDDIDI